MTQESGLEGRSYFILERVFESQSKPGVEKYVVRYVKGMTDRIIFIDSDGTIETANPRDPNKETMLRDFQKYLNSEQGQEKLAEKREAWTKEEKD